MPYVRRQQCESNLYHVIIRGEGRMLIFEDGLDREAFLDLLRRQRAECSVEVIAWCLMGNHAHLLLRAELANISAFMERVERPYARHFNNRHDHVGHLFQGRFKSIPIVGDPQLLETVRYIHRNPVEGGLTESCEYEWSSYGEYLGQSGICSTSLALEMLGGQREFERFHASGCNHERLSSRSLAERRLSDAETRQILSDLLSERGLTALPGDDKILRDNVLAGMKARGASVRQIERVTGIGRNIVARAARRPTA